VPIIDLRNRIQGAAPAGSSACGDHVKVPKARA
jgi:hypothetical protein